MINKGDYVTRNSYNNDVIFEVISVNGEECVLKGVDVRLMADALSNDLVKCDYNRVTNDDETDCVDFDLDKKDFFYIPGTILQLDGDKSYLDRCLNFYKELGLNACGVSLKENDMSSKVTYYLNKFKPNILVITGHDAYQKRSIGSKDLYKNSKYFIDAVSTARKYESDKDKLIIIAGACQSNYLALISNGANFASSPGKVNIHVLDPAIIAANISLNEETNYLDLIQLLSKTKTGKNGFGGIKTKGTMLVGFPRNGGK